MTNVILVCNKLYNNLYHHLPGVRLLNYKYATYFRNKGNSQKPKFHKFIYSLLKYIQ